jgi:two-component system, NarL family, sensor histidine kinase EvgS
MNIFPGKLITKNIIFFIFAISAISSVFAQGSKGIVFTESEAEIIDQSRVLQVWMVESPPYVMKNQDGSFSGIAVDMLKYVSDKTGLIFKYVSPDIELSQESALMTDKADIAPALFSIEEIPNYHTVPYFSSPVYIYAKPNFFINTNVMSALYRKNVTIQKDSPLTRYLIKHFKEIKFVPCPTTQAGLDIVKESLSDAYIGNSLSAYYEIKRNDIKGIISIPSEELPNIQVSFGVTEEHKNLLPILNKVIVSMPGNIVKKFENDNLTNIIVENMIDKKTVKKWFWSGVIIFIAALMIVLYFVRINRILAKEIKSRKQMASSLKKSQDILKLATEDSKIVVFEVFLRDNTIAYGNSLAAFLGYDQEADVDLTYDGWINILEPTSRALFEENMSAIKNDKFDGNFFELRYKNAHGDLCWLKIDGKVTERDTNNQPQKFVGIIMDVTESKEYELAIIESRQEAELANKAKSEFLANMSHEIRTPLNAIIGFSQLLSKQVIDIKQKTYLDSINVAGNSLLTLINDILDLSKIEAGQLKIKLGACSIAHIFKEIEQVFILKVKEKGIDLLFELHNELPPSLIIDEMRLRQVLINLVGNAVKFTEHGYIKLGVDLFYDDQADPSKVSLIISVEDTGIGIEQKHLKKIFAPFKQQDSQDNRLYGGTGLGLSISKRLTEMMNGKLTVTSQVGKGSTFNINLYNISVSSTMHTESTQSINLQSLVYNEETLLIVDDVPSNRILLEELFSGKNLHILSAKNGLETVNIAKKKIPDLIICDIRMPVMDGIEATKILKSTDSTKDIPVIALTASAKQDELEITKELFDGHLTKPVNVDELFMNVNKYIKPKDQKQEPKDTLEDNIEVNISEGIREKLYENILPKLKDEVGAVDISEIQNIAEEMVELGKKVNEDYITNCGEDLLTAASVFNIENINNIISKFISKAEDN